MSSHISVLKKETLEALNIKQEGIYADLTLGGGGYSLEILRTLTKGKLYCFDLEKRSTTNFIQKLETDGFKIKQESVKKVILQHKKVEVRVINDNFENINVYIEEEVDGIVADLGWSSDQLDSISGLSFNNDSQELDMRFSEQNNVKASDLLNVLSNKQLKTMFERYADIYGRENDTLVSAVINYRKKQLFTTVADVKKALNLHLPTQARGDTLIARVFQALRISVNRELSILEESIPIFFELLKKSGVLAIVTFHSGESKIVTRQFSQLERVGRCKFTILKKETENVVPVVRPSVEELRENLRARSAKLFAIEKL